MAKEIFGEYAAFETQGGVRFHKSGRLVAESAVPPEVVQYLRSKLNAPVKSPEPKKFKFPMPSEEEKARLREESLRVKPELVGVNTTVTEEEIAAPVVDPLTEADFVEEYTPEPEFPITETSSSPTVDPDFLESVSIHTAPLESLVQALSERFGIYTVHLGKLPEVDEINPLTGDTFTKYHLGIAYQAAIRAQNTGLLNRPAEEGRRLIDEGRAASANVQSSFVPVATTFGEARKQNTFDYRTSPQGTRTIPTSEIIHVTDENGVVHAVQREIPAGQTGEFNGAKAAYDAEEEEPILQPNFSGRPIIRPNW